MRGETTELALRRELHCAAYNALMAIISCTQTEEKFYHAFLFKDDPDKVCQRIFITHGWMLLCLPQ